MKYALNLADDNRILSACLVFENGNYDGMPLVDELPEGNIADYLYQDSQYVYAPLPEPVMTEDEARAQRYKLLTETDWTQVLDAPVSAESREAFRVYRQALRDITEQAGFPTDIQWPEMPVVVKADPDPVDTAFDALTGKEEA